MLANLQQLPPLLWIVAIIVIFGATAIIIWMRRRRFHITEVELSAGPVKAKMAPQKSLEPLDTTEPPSVNISGNKLFGRTKIGVRREGTNISDNLAGGTTEIDVGAKPGPKPKARKGKRRR